MKSQSPFAFVALWVLITPDAEEFVEDLLGLTEFVFYHELGHALIEAYGIPILGRQEDAADSLAALMAAQLDAGFIALVAADAFDMQSQLQEKIDLQEFWGAHSLNEQRMYSLACLIYGSDPRQFDGLLEQMGMPPEQEERCVAEFQEKSSSWDAVLSPFVKASPEESATPSSIEGRWIHENPESGQRIEYVFGPDGSAAQIVTADGRTKASQGRYRLEGGRLEVQSESGARLLYQVAFQGGDHLFLTEEGGGQVALLFLRQP